MGEGDRPKDGGGGAPRGASSEARTKGSYLHLCFSAIKCRAIAIRERERPRLPWLELANFGGSGRPTLASDRRGSVSDDWLLEHDEIGLRQRTLTLPLRGFPLPVGEGRPPSPSGGRWPRKRPDEGFRRDSIKSHPALASRLHA